MHDLSESHFKICKSKTNNNEVIMTMAKKILISVDSTADLSQELIERYDIRIIPLTIRLGDDSFYDGDSFTPEDMYRRYHQDGTLPQTASPSIEEFIAFFDKCKEDAESIIHLDISSELSNTYNAARLAAEEMEGIYIIDTRMLSTGIALLAIEAAECIEKGMEAAEIADHIEALKKKVSTSFVLDTLEFMWKGGRCSGVTALGANLLRIKPCLEMREGKLEVTKKYRGKIESVYKKYITETLTAKKARPGHIFITESGEIAPEVVEELYNLIKELSGCREVHHTKTGCTVTSHCGPKTMGVLFIEE